MTDPFVYDARRHGLAGDGATNDQPALQRLVDRLGDAYAADGQPRTIRCPSGDQVGSWPVPSRRLRDADSGVSPVPAQGTGTPLTLLRVQTW